MLVTLHVCVTFHACVTLHVWSPCMHASPCMCGYLSCVRHFACVVTLHVCMEKIIAQLEMSHFLTSIVKYIMTASCTDAHVYTRLMQLILQELLTRVHCRSISDCQFSLIINCTVTYWMYTSFPVRASIFASGKQEYR